MCRYLHANIGIDIASRLGITSVPILDTGVDHHSRLMIA